MSPLHLNPKRLQISHQGFAAGGKQVNAMMVRVKEAYAEKKRTLKGYYPQERWIDYGVPDKR